mmetsp:Transcript_100758/g.260341  ORF Transcript_100758/g.260341 Transcript_100758/m.260341 type:complete len:219 (+) Transcript_100758:212-868(+)
MPGKATDSFSSSKHWTSDSVSATKLGSVFRCSLTICQAVTKGFSSGRRFSPGRRFRALVEPSGNVCSASIRSLPRSSVMCSSTMSQTRLTLPEESACRRAVPMRSSSHSSSKVLDWPCPKAEISILLLCRKSCRTESFMPSGALTIEASSSALSGDLPTRETSSPPVLMRFLPDSTLSAGTHKNSWFCERNAPGGAMPILASFPASVSLTTPLMICLR